MIRSGQAHIVINVQVLHQRTKITECAGKENVFGIIWKVALKLISLIGLLTSFQSFLVALNFPNTYRVIKLA